MEKAPEVDFHHRDVVALRHFAGELKAPGGAAILSELDQKSGRRERGRRIR